MFVANLLMAILSLIFGLYVAIDSYKNNLFIYGLPYVFMCFVCTAINVLFIFN